MTTKIYSVSLILAPVCFAVSSFFWQSDGQYVQYSVTAGTLLIAGSVFWVFAFMALFDLLKDKAPRYAAWGLFIAVYGCLCGGVGFALRDIMTLMLRIPHKQMLDTFVQHPVFDNIVFWIGGPAFPSSLLVLGIVLATTKKAPAWVGVMIGLSAVLFPVSRITRIEMIAHIDDALMLVPMGYLGVMLRPI
ncbi:MAG: hypothetical protein JST32_03740 [Bacteroidetes bacterium]|nr:hypothetical protein [Bacteroidota bacterium]